MDAGKIFVGRKDELEQFNEVLKDPKGQAVLVVGQAAMGKTWLVNEMAEIAQNHPHLKCGWVRYEVTPTDSVDSTMALMMDEACEAAEGKLKRFLQVKGRPKQWSALLSACGLIPIVGNKVKALGELVLSLRREPTKDTRTQFIRKLHQISEKMPKDRRAIFVIDPEKYMQEKSDQSWAIVVKELPEKIKFVFAQRPEDVLVESETFGALDNVLQIPEERLDILEEESVEELLTIRSKGLKCTVTEVREVLSRYEGHPYALGAALDLIEGGTKLEELPEKPKPTKFAEVQWREVSNRSEDAIRLFKGYAILEVGVPDDVVEAVSEIDSDTRQHLVADKYISGLLREEGEGRRLYHAILMDYIVEQIGEAEIKEYHSRAVEVYRGKLAKAKKEQIRPDALAATRLAEHVLPAEGKEAFVYAFVNECFEPLLNLGFLDTAISLSERALGMVGKDSENEAAVTGNLGLIYKTKGDLDKAEDMHNKSLEIDKKLGRLEEMASDYGNLGNVYYTRGDLDKAIEMHEKSLEIKERLGLQEGMANSYVNLGTIYCTRGDLDKAAEMHEMSLEIMERLGLQERMATHYGNLGIVYYKRGDLDKAIEMHEKSLKIEEKLGRLEGMASDYSNLGTVYYTRGDLDKAEEMLNKSLEINEKIDRFEGMANDCGNLGNVYLMRGKLDKAEEMYEKSLEINERIGRLEGVANQYCSLGNVYLMRRELDKAEEMHNKSLEINEKISRLEGMANDYGNLGLIYETKGDLDKAEEMYKKALEIHEKIDHLEGVARLYVNLGCVYKQRGDIVKAREYWEKAVGLYKKIGIPHMIEEVEGWISELED